MLNPIQKDFGEMKIADFAIQPDMVERELEPRST